MVIYINFMSQSRQGATFTLFASIDVVIYKKCGSLFQLREFSLFKCCYQQLCLLFCIIQFWMKRKEQQNSKLKGFYPVQAIRSKRFNHKTGQNEYFIKWGGWAQKFNTWEPIQNVMGCQKLIETFDSQTSRIICKQPICISDEIELETPLKKLSNYRSTENFQKGIEHFLRLLQQEMCNRQNQAQQINKVQQPQVVNTIQVDQQVNEFLTQSLLCSDGHQNQNYKTSPFRQQQKFNNKNNIKENIKRSIYPLKKKQNLIKAQDPVQCSKIKKKQDHQSNKVFEANDGFLEQYEIKGKHHGQKPKKKILVSEKQIRESRVSIVDVSLVNGCIQYGLQDESGQSLRAYATKEDFIRINPGILLRFYQDLID